MIALVVAQPLFPILPHIIIVKTSITSIKIILAPPPPLRTPTNYTFHPICIAIDDASGF